MVVNVPRIVESVANDPRDMVRVQFGPNDIRSYTRMEAERLIAGGTVPGAFIVGEGPDDEADAPLAGEGSAFEEAANDLKAKSQHSAPNKARPTAPSKSSPAPTTAPPDDGKGDAGDGENPQPADVGAETKAE